MVISIVMKSLSDSVHNDAYVGIQVPRVGKKFTSKDLSDGLGLAVNSTEAETFISGEECGHINGGDDMSGGDNSDGYEKQSDYNGAEEEFLRAQDYNVETFMDDFLLDSIAVQFHGDIFLVQFGCHVLFPLAYFLINYKAQGFQITYDALIQSSTYFNLVFPMIVYASIITYFLCPLEDELPVRGAFIVPLIFFLQHRMTVGLKYASLSTTEYEKFQNEQDPQRSETFLLQMQLLGGWASRDPLLLQFELGCAAARIGAKINEISITIRDPTASAAALNEFANWNAFLQRQPTVKLSDKPASELIQHDDGSYSLSVYDLTKAIIRKADVSSHQRLKRLIFVFVGTMALVPWVNILFCCGPMNIFMYRSVYLYIFLTTSSLATSIYGVVCFLLLYVAVWDVSRQLHMVRYLHRLIRITDLTLDTDISFRKAQDSQRSREHLREKVGVILSVSKPERRKTIAIKNSLSAKSTGFSERGGGFHGPQSSDTEGTGMSTSTSSGRRVSAKDIKQRFVDFGTKSVKDEDRSHIPQISFKCPENVIGWTYSRLVFQHFGERFRTRIDTYTGGTMLLMLALMGTELLMVIIDPHPMRSFSTVFFQQSILTVILTWLFLLVCTSLGALVNSQLSLHSRTFAAHKLRIRDEILILTALRAEDAAEQEQHAQELSQLRESLEVLDDCKDVVETYAELKPFAVFGFKIESATVFTIFTTGVSFFGILFSIYSNAKMNAQNSS